MDKREKTLLAILGRGAQRIAANGSWEPTEDLEICDGGFRHLPFRAPETDDHRYSVIGGGKLNIAAGAVLYHRLEPELVVCAYGNRSPYLIEADGPSESEIMTAEFVAIMETETGKTPRVKIFDESDGTVEGAGTYQEVLNILNLARQTDIRHVALVTVAVHMPRTVLMASEHRKTPAFQNIHLSYHVSEFVLMEAHPHDYAERVGKLFASESWSRNWLLERTGIRAFRSGQYQFGTESRHDPPVHRFNAPPKA